MYFKCSRSNAFNLAHSTEIAVNIHLAVTQPMQVR